MPRTATTLTIAKPCAELWQQMTPVPNGRHCAACRETVTDFTQMTDAEILRFLRHNPAVSCGRFTEEQLDRELRRAPEATPRWRTWLAAAATVLGLREVTALESRAQKVNQEVADIPRPEAAARFTPYTYTAPDELAQQEARQQQAEEMAAPGGRVILRGSVHNRWGLPLGKARVVVVDMPELKATTNALGHFYLEVPASAVAGSTKLRVSRPGHRSSWVEVASPDSHRYHVFLKSWGRRRVLAGKFR
ncbi:carboxypeptidase-like regulatory domain-containing protein [Hymenobacter chitinivorans]|uniref:Carboxypeptidase family protein n=1 Tax=Hymenobacter chitinivorans DSM 11115 TaxID=1121954 RepID=A0A2M9ARU3_9BACT|nr:carboxypeptidase-like regulatory domain-containing protein [Hymenobacter chitinivorans]PJJ48435.1 hypothetical protein CLV45_4142 [Hymenobacter chitinivorans DSM 11115]